MSTSGTPTRLRSRRVAIIAAGALALIVAVSMISRTETVASFTDSVWAGGTFNVADVVDLEGATAHDGEFDDHASEGDALVFSPPISLLPGETTYAQLYLRTAGHSTAATVALGAASNEPTPSNALWDEYLTYGARAIELPADPGAVTCNADVFNSATGTELITRGAGLDTDPTGEFGLDAQSGSTVLVCFEFHLSADVTDAPTLNGATVDPVWTFTGVTAP